MNRGYSMIKESSTLIEPHSSDDHNDEAEALDAITEVNREPVEGSNTSDLLDTHVEG